MNNWHVANTDNLSRLLSGHALQFPLPETVPVLFLRWTYFVLYPKSSMLPLSRKSSPLCSRRFGAVALVHPLDGHHMIRVNDDDATLFAFHDDVVVSNQRKVRMGHGVFLAIGSPDDIRVCAAEVFS